MFFSVFAIDLYFIFESHRVFGVATNPALAFYILVIVYAWLGSLFMGSTDEGDTGGRLLFVCRL